jgi:DNA-binding NarL/FixJ family response regulator
MPLRVILADTEEKVRSALRLLIEQERSLEIVGEAAEATALLAGVEARQPDVVLVDWALLGTEAREMVRSLHLLHSDLTIIVLSGRPEVVQAALDSGADTFVSKGDPPDHLLTVLRAMSSDGYRRAAGEAKS